MVKKISFKNYKIFRSKQTLELRPITILIGKNNSGKSAVAELVTMIAGSLSGEFSAPYSLKSKIGNDSTNAIELGTAFEDLVYNRNSIVSLEFEITDDSKPEGNRLEVILSKSGILEHRFNGQKSSLEHVKTRGFLIEGEKIENSLSINLDYIGAIRVSPDRSYILTNEEFDKIGVNGRNAYPILIQDNIKENLIKEKVSEWYKKNFEGWEIEVIKNDVKTEVQYQLAISNNGIDAVNIKNVGQGIHQVLPLIVRTYMLDRTPTVIIVEEPETHLHPAAHGSLAQRFADSYLEDKDNKRYLIETHSQNFVLRMRRMVASGALKPKDLAIYYVDFDEDKRESTLQLLEVDEYGGVNFWPEGVFNETSKEVRSIYNAQLNRRSNVD